MNYYCRHCSNELKTELDEQADGTQITYVHRCDDPGCESNLRQVVRENMEPLTEAVKALAAMLATKVDAYGALGRIEEALTHGGK